MHEFKSHIATVIWRRVVIFSELKDSLWEEAP